MPNPPTAVADATPSPRTYVVRIRNNGPLHQVWGRQTRVTGCGIDFITLGGALEQGVPTCEHCLNMRRTQGTG